MKKFLEYSGASAVSLLLGLLLTASAYGSSSPAVDHQLWGDVLERFVDDDGFVDYQGILDEPATFNRYIDQIENIGPESHPALFNGPEEELAYYINAYKALVFKGVLARGPEPESVWRGLISGYNFFVRMDIRIGGRETNLKSLEDDVIREVYKDPRIHAAINCASIGCPRLIQQPYLGTTLDDQLQEVMVGFLNDEQHIQVDSEKRIVRISKIFKWFEEDFLEYEASQGNTRGTKTERMLQYINRFRSESQRIPVDYEIEHLKYDKGINSRQTD